MHPIVALLEKPSRLVAGIMSGTSADGVDVALCRISGHGLNSQIQQLGFCFQPFSWEIRNEILRLASGEKATASDFCRINFLLGHLYAEAVEALLTAQGLSSSELDLIGSHGQTLWHLPQEETYLGRTFRSTLQLGECSVLAQRFGCPVVGDFRVRDMAAGGLGAPLVPYSEFLIYRSQSECIALQNIGGIGNITCLPLGCSMDQVFAFDTGPGNMVMDAVYTLLTHGEQTYDAEGAFAARGTTDGGLMAMLLADPYPTLPPPKTTGREYYGPAFVEKIMAYARDHALSPEDLMATVTDFTAQTIRISVERFFPQKPDKLIVGGGGSMNRTLLEDIAKALPGTQVMTNEALGLDSNAKEAVAFAVLANEAIFAQSNNVPSVTGASQPVVMGKISL